VSDFREEAKTDDIEFMATELEDEFAHAVQSYHASRCLTERELRLGRRWGGTYHCP